MPLLYLEINFPLASLGMLPPVMVVKMLGALFEEMVLVFSCHVEVVVVELTVLMLSHTYISHHAP